ncbi:2-oxo-tetronate isomerase [Bacillus dakarensis]|uniref:2-oxo-tetronate isomerase n=1 Tax=Robertmurraya dakarensis TaxID=1926278 RepID=UPI0009811C62|nr:2-oxo-tetronate isomerase [Bacillus dakarensis]
MNQFSVNISTVFTEYPFLDRFKKAREAGFQYVECQFPYDYSIEAIKAELNINQLTLDLINLYPGDWSQGERGLAIDPNRQLDFRESVEKGIQYAQALDVKKIHCMAGIIKEEFDNNQLNDLYIKNIQYAAEKMAEHDITILIEPINTFDMPGYFLCSAEQAVKLLNKIDCHNVKIQFDFYHIQRIQGNLLSTFEQMIDKIGHVQIADVPGRHQPGTGEVQYENIFRAVKELGYDGHIGLEYIPKGKSEESFTWLPHVVKGDGRP